MHIQPSENAPLIRTDFSCPEAWQKLVAAVSNPADPFLFTMQIVDDRTYDRATVEQLVAALPGGHPHACLVVADSTSMSLTDHPLLVVDLVEERGRRFRAIAAEIAAIDNNLSIANMGFGEFANAVDESGVFRGFDEPR